MVYDNDEELLAQVADYMVKADKRLRLGTGQYSDSLALDKETGLSKKLIELFAGQDKHLLELKTKSAEVDHLLALDHCRRTVMAWSVNPEALARSEELGAESLAARLVAAKRCVAAGYPVAFHFDPIIYYAGWDNDYQAVVDLIFTEISESSIAWISLGALRFQPELKELAANKFPSSMIFKGSLCFEVDKMRYPEQLRIELFNRMVGLIRGHSKTVYLYLCMESPKVWAEVNLGNCQNNPYQGYFDYSRKTKIQ